ncbi:MAG TPA: 1-(5-phosphoribosyl)-5-((5-phosphoribosylamino)methylideneamino)imidazole-4-carboxamide isomerase [Gammaproteobacteria bacterium]|nr:1-(5-phosphoribosyl)-5-((5-phosphoribosylamino)methylideneamino)imidazole-4-carboxamide isomerase [Gammaproteobacteria bacterium]
MGPIPSAITLHQKSRLLEVVFGPDERYELSCEFLRVHSPSAEVRGHGPGQGELPLGKEHVNILTIEPVGQYAVRLVFDDGHDTGLYTWAYLQRLGRDRDRLWQTYLDARAAAGAARPGLPPQTEG